MRFIHEMTSPGYLAIRLRSKRFRMHTNTSTVVRQRQTATMADEKAQKKETNVENNKPQTLSMNHQDAVFGNAFGSRSYYVVHPEWISEVKSDPSPVPLHRPPWPWEQPRYRVNLQAPITYDSPAEGIEPVGEEKEIQKEEDRFLQEEVPPISYQLSQLYKSTHPEYVMRY